MGSLSVCLTLRCLRKANIGVVLSSRLAAPARSNHVGNPTLFCQVGPAITRKSNYILPSTAAAYSQCLTHGAYTTCVKTIANTTVVESLCGIRIPLTIRCCQPCRHFTTGSANYAQMRPAGRKPTPGSYSKTSRAKMRTTQVALISGMLVAVVTTYLLQRQFNKKRRGPVKPGVETHQDPLMGKDAAMLKYKDTWIPKSLYGDNFKKISNFPLNDEDVLVVSFPKSGTTWVQEMVSMVLTDVNVDKAQQKTMEDRFPYLEYVYPGLASLQKEPGPRMIKSHLPYHLLPVGVQYGKGKVIYVARNPKDVCVSYFHFSKMFTPCSYRGEFTDFFKSFVFGKVNYGPWWEHVSSFWMHREQKNVLVLMYEDIHKDPHKVVKQISEFLNHPLSSKQISAIVEHCSFQKMQNNPSTNYTWWDDLGLRHKDEANFLRKGKVGDWQNYFTEDMSKLLDLVCEERLKPLGITFNYGETSDKVS